MAYSDIAALQQDSDFAYRVMAAYAVETLDEDGAVDPGSWQAIHSWDMAAQPGFGDAYASALAQDPPNPRPGNDPAVITDGQILSAIQALLPTVEPTDPEPEPDPAP